MSDGPYIVWGCIDERCGYKLAPNSMPTPYAACPLCGNKWIADPPPQLKTTGYSVTEHYPNGRVNTIVIRPHLMAWYRQVKAQTEAKKKPKPADAAAARSEFKHLR